MIHNRHQIHIWVPELNQTGGIQAFSRFLIKAMRKSFDGEVHVFSKKDKTSPVIAELQGCSWSAFGETPSTFQTIIFSFNILFAAFLRHPQLIIVTHAHFAVIALILKKILKQKYLVIAHGVEVWNINNWLLKKAIRNADKVLAVSNFTKQRLISQNLAFDGGITIFPNTFDETRFCIGMSEKKIFEKYGIRNQDQILLTVCRLVQSEFKKGYDLVLRAMVELSKQLPDLKYVIIGDGEDRCHLDRTIKNLHLSERVILAGRVSDEELPKYYKSANIFVMPSEREGFGIVYLEALACGLPVIAARCAGAVDALMGGELGDLIEPGDVIGLTRKIYERLMMPYSFDMKTKLNQKASYYFGQKKFNQRLSSILNQVLND
ncbi:MAG TPA: glycosyltransferase [Candidatus Omnitrophota bacterium]|nr:glycosyltransferase [Candidatus Omnitrophota bacterium]